ncbi:MAG: sulfite exporter TauE/SafE family protein [Deltaproteobacteria bacterium]|nr:sulfite exporter TauE/SafE family protein [Deltaproteobacteria bacterium]
MLLGFGVAIFSAGIGIGGGTLLVSFLISISNFDFKKAAATSLATIIPISFIGAVNHLFFIPQSFHPQYYFTFIPACIVDAVLGTKIIKKYQNGWLKPAFAFFLLIISLRMLKIFDFPSLIYTGLNNILLPNQWALIISIGLSIGIIAIVLGIGCGLLIVPFFTIVIDLNIHEAITLSLTSIFFIAVSSVLINNKLKALGIDIASLKNLFIPALAGAIIGSIISGQLPDPILIKIFGIFLFLIALNYIIKDIYQKKRKTAWASQKQNINE